MKKFTVEEMRKIVEDLYGRRIPPTKCPGCGKEYYLLKSGVLQKIESCLDHTNWDLILLDDAMAVPKRNN